MVMLCFFYDSKVPREIIQLLLSGRGMVIAITIVFSCLSFTLGFVVGKFGSPKAPALPAISQEQTLPMQNNQNNQEGRLQTPPPAETLRAQPELAGTSISPTQTPIQIPIQPSAKAGETARSTTPASEPSGAETAREPREPSATQLNELSKTAAREDSKEVATQKPGQKTYQKPDAGKPLFAVQLGAFRNKAEADKCRAKYSKKGYKLYTKAEKANKGPRVYKVRTGEFREKKDAELLALKLKKTDNLHAFVVTTTE